MSRRNIRHQEIPADIRKLRVDAENVLKGYTREAKAVADSITAMQSEESACRARLNSAIVLEQAKNEALRVLDSELEDRRKHLVLLGSELQKSSQKLESAKFDLGKFILEEKRAVAQLRSEHASALSVYEKQLKALQDNLDAARNQLAELESEKSVLVGQIGKLRAEDERLRQTLTEFRQQEPLYEQRVGERMNIEKEIVGLEERYATLLGKLSEEKRRYDEVVARRNGEEKALEERRTQLIEKEESVEKKMRNLRQIQLGVDTATKRLERREQELEIKLHLANKPSDVIES